MTDHAYALPSGFMLDEYRIDRVIGSGGFGITYYAWDTYLNKPVAIKEYMPNEFAVRLDETTVAPKSSADDNDYQWGLERFLEEAATLASFNHPNINKVYRRIEAHGTAYMVLEYIPGETLSARLKRDPQLPPNEIWQLFSEMLSGLDEVHRMEYVHRDIKPGNIMFREDGSAVLLDFGAARQAIGQRSKSVTSILTPGYAPIEQYDQNADDVGPWTDFYALGIVAYRCVTGRTERELIDAVARARLASRGDMDKDMPSAIKAAKGQYDERLLKAIDWCIKVDERDRPKDVAALNDSLAGQGQPAPTVAPTRVEPSVAPKAASGPNKDIKIVGIVVAVLLAVGLLAWGVGALQSGGSEPGGDGADVARVPEVTPDPAVAEEEQQDAVGHVLVSSNVPAEVRVDGRVIGRARPDYPIRGRNIPVGSALVEAAADGYITDTRSVRVRTGEWTRVAVELEAQAPAAVATGSLRVRVNVPNAVVRIDGELAGGATSRTPALKEGLSRGRHSVSVSASGYASQTRSVQIAAGQVEEVRFDLVADGPPPANATQIREAQTELHRIGYYRVGRPDGIAGAKTREALEQFQASEGLRRTGTIDQALVDRLKRKRRQGNEFFVKDECDSPIELIIHYKDLRGSWQTRAWWQFESGEEAYLAHQNIRLSGKKGTWYFYARATDDSGLYWDDNEGNGKRLRHNGESFEMRRMNSTGDRAEITLTCN